MKKEILFIILLAYSWNIKAQYEVPVFIYPNDNIQDSIDAHSEGTLYILKEGTYRMQKFIPKSQDIIIGEPGAIINGSLILNNWIQEGPYWTHTIDPNLAANSYGSPCQCEIDYPQVADPECGTKRYEGCIWHQSMFIDGDYPLWREMDLDKLDNLPDTLVVEGLAVEPFYGDWYYDILSEAIAYGYFTGYSDGTFKPNKYMTRGEIAEAIARFFKIDINSEDSITQFFTDVSGNKYEKQINLVARNRLMNGYPDKTFKPDSFTTRVEAAIFFDGLFNRYGTPNVEPSFFDVAKDFWAYGHIESVFRGFKIVNENGKIKVLSRKKVNPYYIKEEYGNK